MGSPTAPDILLQPEGVRISGAIKDLAGFRTWTRSDRFPERGRIDWLDDLIEVDMAPEDLNTHGSVKLAIARDLGTAVESRDRGVVYVDSTRYSAPDAGLSVEPDVLVVLFESLESGSLRLIPKAGHTDRYVELEGRADLVVECVSDSSVVKDTERLLGLYERAGVREYWIVDARGAAPSLRLLTLGSTGYRPVAADAEGFVGSPVLAARVRLVRLPERLGVVRYRLEWGT